ncbi:hypothetical protein JOQ06_002307 [Pogonophryne albipinna]|uniref:Uncharacterized protein n=1 Tax=Pogonophryne albipinna TaxID=1090488 RepID=A0AAD6B7K2_9TELE|nr:hypothetical protein JOQ06_002307 [Pogonophryne albipinna]
MCELLWTEQRLIVHGVKTFCYHSTNFEPRVTPAKMATIKMAERLGSRIREGRIHWLHYQGLLKVVMSISPVLLDHGFHTVEDFNISSAPCRGKQAVYVHLEGLGKLPM